jgi:hypothetical protein
MLMILNTTVIIAQNGGETGSFQRMGFGPRGMAMGNAMSAVIGDGVYGYYNPAMTALRTERRQIDISSAVMHFDRNLNMLNAHFNLPPIAGIGIYLLHAGVRNIDGRTSSGYHTQMLSTNEYQIGTQFGMRFADRIWGGIGLKFNMARYHDELSTSNAFGADIGFIFRISEKIITGFTVQDLLASYQWHAGNLYGDDFNMASEHSFPVRMKAGISYIPSEPFIFSSEYEYRIHSSSASRTDYYSSFLRFGGKYDLHEHFTLRCGFRFPDMNTEITTLFSAGFSIHLPLDKFSPSIDYTFAEEPNRISNLHVFAIRLFI